MAEFNDTVSLKTGNCPHWSLQNKSCQLSTDGLFLPVKNHIQIYCEGGNYASCKLAAKGASQKSIDGRRVANRRRYLRVPSSYQLDFVEFSKQKSRQVLGKAATVVDISRGGIRLESPHLLAEGEKIIFSFSDNSSAVQLKGKGQVKWCKTLGKDQLYQAGISFVEDDLSSTVNDQLGLFVH